MVQVVKRTVATADVECGLHRRRFVQARFRLNPAKDPLLEGCRCLRHKRSRPIQHDHALLHQCQGRRGFTLHTDNTAKAC